ncbi:TIGR02147 family protein [Vulgatibacter sp.]|uniref:TIGR02147 family protein n=1 Tax=Vulgatibacter sp. TaxID=1971226 RepID=UPI003567485E
MVPSVYDFLDYRQYLRAWYDAEKARLPAFSYRYFARKAGFASPNFLKLVIEGDRNLSLDSVDRFLEVLKLPEHEAVFFRDLVSWNQARNLAEKNLLFERVIASKRFQEWRKLDASRLEYLRHWYYPAIRELAAHPDFEADPDWIGPRLLTRISREEILRALRVLEDLGLLERDAGGKLGRGERTLSTGVRVQGDELKVTAKTFLRQMMEQASEALDAVPAALRDVGAITVAVKPETVAELKERIQRFRREMLERCDQDDGASEVYQVNIQLFPLTRKPKD